MGALGKASAVPLGDSAAGVKDERKTGDVSHVDAAPGAKVKRTAKDTVFCDLFSDKKYLLQLYQELHPEDQHTTEKDLTSVTLKSILTNGIYNDLGFLVGDKQLLLVESQSTWTPNILLRGLFYLVITYQDYCSQHGINLYATKLAKLPKPELYVIYTKKRGRKPSSISLKRKFFLGENPCIDATAKVIYEDDSHSIIDQYVKFCRILDDQIKKCGRCRKALMETISICRSKDLLADYLKKREKEVIAIMDDLFNQDKAFELFVRDEREKAVEEAVKEERQKVSQAEARADKAEADAAMAKAENKKLLEIIKKAGLSVASL